MIRFVFSALVLTSFLGSAGARAEDSATTSSAPAVEPYQLKVRSSFKSPGEDARIPFWPIGWVKRKGESGGPAQQIAAVPKVAIDEKSFRVTSILLGSGTTPSLAVVNGRAYSEGEFLRMPKGTTPPMRIRVQRISDGTVLLQHEQQTLIASLQRPELSTNRPEQVLNDDR